MKDIYLSLGSNTGNSIELLGLAIEALKNKGAQISNRSSVYRSEPWGNENLAEFLNMVLKIEWGKEPEELLRELKDIERRLGRKDVDLGVKKEYSEYKDRPIDIDILFMDDVVFESSTLVIPHPLFRERLFVLLPMTEIAGMFKDPLTKKSMFELLKECSDPNKVEVLS